MRASTNKKISLLSVAAVITLFPVLSLVESRPYFPFTLLGFGNLLLLLFSVAFGPVARWVSRFYQSSLFANAGDRGLLAMHRDFAVRMLKLIGLWVEASDDVDG